MFARQIEKSVQLETVFRDYQVACVKNQKKYKNNEELRKYNSDPLATAMRQAQKPFKDHRAAIKDSEKRRAEQKYIPGKICLAFY